MSDEPSINRAAIRKSKSFKRIRGLLKGLKKGKKSKSTSKSSKSVTKSSSKNALRSSRSDVDEADTVYDVDVEDRSVVSRATMDAPKAYLLKVVLLLMDPETRRFELLQLEFDSMKATVSDVMGQIPLSVTEDSLRQQTYVAICGPDAKDMPPASKLADFCNGNEVLVAIPSGLPAKECVRLAKPIILDEKVGRMLESSGINASEWSSAKKSFNTMSSGRALSAISEPETSAPVTTPTQKRKKKRRGSGFLFLIVLVALISILLQVFHLYISASIQRGNIVAPDIWLRKCGLNFYSCPDNAYFRVHNGKAIYSNGQHEVIWIMEGAVCTKEECQPGMQVKLDGSIAIGDKNVHTVTMYQHQELSPWPFAEDPKVKIRKAKGPAPSLLQQGTIS